MDNFLPLSPEMASFLQQIKAAPEDLSLRLIFADWLEEQNDPRGPLLRLQCELADLPTADPYRSRVQEKETQLLQPLQQWMERAPSCLSRWEFQRGLLSLSLDLKLDVSAKLSQISESEWWPWCGSLNPSVRTTEVATLVRSECLQDLISLQLWFITIDEAGAQAFAESSSLRNLTSLKLWKNNLDATGAATILSSVHLSNLRELSLGANQIRDEGAMALAEVSHLNNLTQLDLWNNRIGYAGTKALADSPILNNLSVLYLGANPLGDAGAEALAESAHLGNLTFLNLWSNGIGDGGGNALANSTRLVSLKRLHLRGNGIGGSATEALQQRFGDAVSL